VSPASSDGASMSCSIWLAVESVHDSWWGGRAPCSDGHGGRWAQGIGNH
jgi:hypothetical protein